MATNSAEDKNKYKYIGLSQAGKESKQAAVNKNETKVYNTTTLNKFGYWINGIDVTQQNIDNVDPFIQGVSRLFVLQTPTFMDTNFNHLTAVWKSMMETGITSLSGINDITAEFVDFEGGFNGQRFSNVSRITDDTDTITVQIYEQTGSPVKNFIETWMTGVRDPRNGVATYHQNSFVDPDSVRYSESNHNAEFLYMTMDPTAKNLEYACLFAKVFPTKVPKTHLNYEKGNRDNVLLDLEFRCVKYESPWINDLAASFLINDSIKYSYLNFKPDLTKYLASGTPDDPSTWVPNTSLNIK